MSFPSWASGPSPLLALRTKPDSTCITLSWAQRGPTDDHLPVALQSTTLKVAGSMWVHGRLRTATSVPVPTVSYPETHRLGPPILDCVLLPRATLPQCSSSQRPLCHLPRVTSRPSAIGPASQWQGRNADQQHPAPKVGAYLTWRALTDLH